MPAEEDLSNLTPEQIEDYQRKNCVFCQIAQGKIPSKKIFEDEKCLAVLDISPANLGHMLLMPKEHYSVMPQLPDELAGHLFLIAKKLSQAAMKAFKLKGTTIFVANGMAAGQKAPHVLIHIIPRAFDDGIDLMLPQTKADQKPLKDLLAKLLQQGPRSMPVSKPIPEARVAEKKPEPLPAGKIARLGIKRMKGYLYFIDKEGDVAMAKMARGGKKGMQKKKKVKIVYVPKRKVVYVTKSAKPKKKKQAKQVYVLKKQPAAKADRKVAKKVDLDDIARLFK
jgi:histidine triad (HIT) family protein